MGHLKHPEAQLIEDACREWFEKRKAWEATKRMFLETAELDSPFLLLQELLKTDFLQPRLFIAELAFAATLPRTYD